VVLGGREGTAAVWPARRQALRPREAVTAVVAAPRRATETVPLQYREATAAEAARWLARAVAVATEEMRRRQTTTR